MIAQVFEPTRADMKFLGATNAPLWAGREVGLVADSATHGQGERMQVQFSCQRTPVGQDPQQTFRISGN